jgi:hypothetical protein
MSPPTVVPTIQCRYCKNTDVRRSHRNGPFERLGALIGFYPFRCHACQKRFLLPRKSATPAPPSERRQERVKLDKKRTWRLVLLFVVSFVLFLLFAWKFILPEPAQQTGAVDVRQWIA